MKSSGLSEMTLGTVQLGLSYGIANRLGKPDPGTAEEMLLTAASHGVNSLDTALGYGDSQQIIGAFLVRNPGIARTMHITTKIYAEAREGSSEKELEQELTEKTEACLQALGLQQLDFLMLHRPEDLWKSGGALNRVMRRLVEKRYAREAGVSVYTRAEIDEMLRHPVYRAVQLPLSVLDQRLLKDDLLGRLEAQDFTVFVRSVFSQGLIFLDPETLEHPLLRDFARQPLKLLRSRSESLGLSPAEYALSFIRSLPGISSIVLGADSPSQVAGNAALFRRPPMAEDEFQYARTCFGSVPFEIIMEALR